MYVDKDVRFYPSVRPVIITFNVIKCDALAWDIHA